MNTGSPLQHAAQRRAFSLALGSGLGLALLPAHALKRETEIVAEVPSRDGIPPMRLERVSPRCYFVQGLPGAANSANAGFNSNAGAVATGEGLVVFDTLGTPALARTLREILEKTTGEKTRIVVISHYHADHYYGIQEFSEPGIRIIAHPKAAQVIADPGVQDRLAQRRRDLFPWVDDSTRLILAPEVAQIGPGRDQVIRLGSTTLTLIDGLSAHAPDDLMMRVEEEGVLYAGDLFFTGRIPFVGTADPKRWLAALDRMAEKPPRVALPGHGAASYDAAQDIDLTRRYLRHLQTSMAKAVEQLLSFDEAYESTDWSQFSAIPAFQAANRLNAYGVFIRAEQASLKGE